MYIKDGSNESYMASDVNSEIYSVANRMVNLSKTEKELAEEAMEHPSLANSYVSGKKLYMWGWLGNKVPNQKWSSQELKSSIVNKLEQIPEDCKVEFCCGWHDCEICNKNTGFNGSIYISYKKKAYCCPNGVEHYIKDHDYCPPKIVIEAILNGSPMSGYDCTMAFIKEHKRKINKQYRILDKERVEREENRKMRDIRMKRVEDSRTPEQKSVLDRWKKDTLDLI